MIFIEAGFAEGFSCYPRILAQILLAFDHIGLAVQLQESLEARSHSVVSDTTQVSGPSASLRQVPEVVVLLGDDCTKTLADTASAWRKLESPPGIVVVGSTDAAGTAAREARTQFVSSLSDIDVMEEGIQTAAQTRFSFALEARLALGAIGLVPAGSTEDDAVRIVSMGREVDVAVVKEALRPHVWDYVLATDRIKMLRSYRALLVPEVEFCHHLDGTKTLQTLVGQGPLDQGQTAQLVWRLASVDALILSPEPHDLLTTDRRRLAVLRDHLRARQHRLARSTYYDVLEVTPAATITEIEQAVSLLGFRYSPERLHSLDLGQLAGLAGPLWEQIIEAKRALSDISLRGRYNDWLSENQEQWRSEWVSNDIDAKGAVKIFSRGQQSLMRGDTHRAVSDMAAACRMHPQHPDYEVSLAWARYRVEIDKGKERKAIAERERATAEKVLAGRRPWPRALLALGLLCMADGDPESARWHLHEALAIDPNMPAAKQILQRLNKR